MLNETALRKPGFRPDEPIKGLDGQTWYMVRPVRLYVASDDDDGYEVRWDMGDEFAKLIDQVRDSRTNGDVFRNELNLAYFLFSRNYNITRSEMGQFFALCYDPKMPPEVAEMVETARDVMYGRARPEGRPGDGSS